MQHYIRNEKYAVLGFRKKPLDKWKANKSKKKSYFADVSCGKKLLLMEVLLCGERINGRLTNLKKPNFGDSFVVNKLWRKVERCD